MLQPHSFIHSFINHLTVFPGCNIPGVVPCCTASVRIRCIPVSDRETRNVQHSRLHITTVYKYYYIAIYQVDNTLIFIFSYKLCKRGLTRCLKHFSAQDGLGNVRTNPFLQWLVYILVLKKFWLRFHEPLLTWKWKQSMYNNSHLQTRQRNVVVYQIYLDGGLYPA
jgi:hypothetical protein